MDIEVLATAVSSMKTQLTVVEKTSQQTQTDVAILLERSDHAKENCPMRVDIARAGNGAMEARKDAREASVLAMEAVKLAHVNEVGLAKIGIAAGGGIGIGGVLFALISRLLSSV